MLEKINIIHKSFLIPKCISKIKNWHVPLLFYFGVNKNEKIIFLKDGSKCFIRNKSDAIAFLENFILEVNTSHKIFQIQYNDIIIDIGAHVGYFTLFAAKKAYNGKIIAFEPSKNSFLVLKENVLMNNYTNIIIENKAVSKLEGKIKLFIDKNNEIGNSIFNKHNNSNYEQIETTTLENIFAKHNLDDIDLLKMDCEGAEYEIILNLSNLLLNKIKKMAIEIHEDLVPYKKENLVEYLEKNGFNVIIKKTINGIKMELPMLFAWK